MNIPANAIFIDTSAWFAYLDKQSPHHKEALETIRESENRLLTSDCVLWELSRSAQPGINREQLSNLIWWFVGKREHQLLKISEDEELEAWEIYLKYDSPNPSLADCTNLIIISKHKIHRWLSFNRWLPKTIEDVSAYLESVLPAGKQQEKDCIMLSIEIDTYDSHLAFDLMDVKDTTSLQEGYQRSILDDVTLTYQKTLVRKAFGAPETISLLLTIGSSVATNVLSSWLYDKLKDRKITLRIDKAEIKVEKDEIARTLDKKKQNPD